MTEVVRSFGSPNPFLPYLAFLISSANCRNGLSFFNLTLYSWKDVGLVEEVQDWLSEGDSRRRDWAGCILEFVNPIPFLIVL